eukprot:symbB.v1.2.020706.t1/scaffold1760.1/size102730/4
MIVHSTWTFCCVVRALFDALFGRAELCDGVEFLEGYVTHARTHEASHAFRYEVRMALIDLDFPPPWWSSEPIQRLSAEEARSAAKTTGKVKLLTTPAAAQYHQNPIQIYFCENHGEWNVGICEVTNTPWNHHVFFIFDLAGDERPKPLHVSPLMDLQHRWRLKATPPPPACDGESHGSQMDVFVDVLPGLEGNSPPIFKAHLKLERSASLHARAEHAGSFKMLWRYGFQPQRTALRIYWNALKLLRKGVKFRSHPSPEFKEEVLNATKRSKVRWMPWWRDNPHFPWKPRPDSFEQ